MVAAPSPGARAVRFGPFELDFQSGELRKGGVRVSLQDQPLQILVVLLENPSELVTREQLRQRLWPGDTFVDFEGGLNAAVRRLRDSLGDSAETPRFVETVPRRGYRFIAPVNGAAPSPASGDRPFTSLPGWVAVAIIAGVVALALAVSPRILERGRPGLTAGRNSRRGDGAPVPVRFTIEVEQSGVAGGVTAGAVGPIEGLVALCPDGSCVAYRGANQGIARLYLRRFDRSASTPLPATEHAYGPFFSPDGRSLGFFADGRLKRISVDGFAEQSLCEAPDGWSGSWGRDGNIFFAPRQGGPISRVAADGGAPAVVTRLDAQTGEKGHRWPVVVPDGRVLLFESMDTSGKTRIIAQSLETGQRKVLIEGGRYPRFAASGHLLFIAGSRLKAVPIDLRDLSIHGSPVDLLDTPFGVRGARAFDVSLNGTLVWMARPVMTDSILWRVERSGLASPLTDQRRAFAWPRFSPDGGRLAVTISDEAGSSIWIYDPLRRSLTRLTFEGSSEAAIWTPDGRRLTYRSDRAGPWNLFLEPADGAGPVERLTTSDLSQFPASWSPDGHALSFLETDPVTGPDISILSVHGGRTRTPFLNSAFGEWDGVFSPDGGLIAYASIESGRLEVYLRRYPGPRGKRQISSEGGNSPVWARSGKELFYLNGAKMMSVPIENRSELTVGNPKLLFEREYDGAGNVPNYDVSPDGRGFVMIRSDQPKPWMQLNVVLNWFEELKRLAPTSPEM